MRATTISRWMLVGVGMLAAASMAACSAKGAAPAIAGQGNTQSITPAASAVASPAPTAEAPTAVAPSTTTTPAEPVGVQNLVISSATKNELTAVIAAYWGIPLSDVRFGGPIPGSVYYAYDPATQTYWAYAYFDFTSAAPASLQLSVEEGVGSDAMYKMTAGGPWQIQIAQPPLLCAPLQYFPPPVLQAWAIATTPPPDVICNS